MVDFIYVLQSEQRYFARLNPQPTVTKSSRRLEAVQEMVPAGGVGKEWS
ncbi:MAG: hypothetical protein R2911_05205 [Caldilineaceae bacterium]